MTELADGIKLIALVNSLTGQELVSMKIGLSSEAACDCLSQLPEKGISMHHQTLNVEKVLNCLQQQFDVRRGSVRSAFPQY